MDVVELSRSQTACVQSTLDQEVNRAEAARAELVRLTLNSEP
jgi:hypothetical protein